MTITDYLGAAGTLAALLAEKVVTPLSPVENRVLYFMEKAADAAKGEGKQAISPGVAAGKAKTPLSVYAAAEGRERRAARLSLPVARGKKPTAAVAFEQKTDVFSKMVSLSQEQKLFSQNMVLFEGEQSAVSLVQNSMVREQKPMSMSGTLLREVAGAKTENQTISIAPQFTVHASIPDRAQADYFIDELERRLYRELQGAAKGVYR